MIIHLKNQKPLELKNSELEKLKHMNESELLQFLNNDDILIQFLMLKNLLVSMNWKLCN